MQVRDFERCAMSFYHGRRELSSKLSRRIRATEQSLALDRGVAHVDEVLREAFPGMGE